MRVEVRLFATLAAFLPPGGSNGVAVLEVAEGATLEDVARRLGIPAALSCVSLVNGEDAEPRRRLADRDVVTLFPPLAGGGWCSRSAAHGTEPH